MNQPLVGSNASHISETTERVWCGIWIPQLMQAYLHFGFVLNSIRLRRQWRRFDADMIDHHCLVEQIFLLHVASWFWVCYVNHWSAYVLFALVYMRFVDLVRHFLYDQKTLFPLIVTYPYALKWLIARREHDE